MFDLYFSVYPQALQESIDAIKNTLVGDLSYDDLNDIMRSKTPRSLVALQTAGDYFWSKPEQQNKSVVMKQFGLIGWLLGFNVAVIRATSDPKALVDLVKDIDHQPQARKIYKNATDGIPMLISTSGMKGRMFHNEFIKQMPSLHYVAEIAVRLSKAAINKILSKNPNVDQYQFKMCDMNDPLWKYRINPGEVHFSTTGLFGIFINPMKRDEPSQAKIWQLTGNQTTINEQTLNDLEFKKLILDFIRPEVDKSKNDLFKHIEIKDLVTEIMVAVMIDSKITDEIKQLLILMQSFGTNNSTSQYKPLVTMILEERLASGSITPNTALDRVIKKTVKPITAIKLADDAFINTLLTALVTIDNVTQALSQARSLYLKNPDLKASLFDEMKASSLDFKSNEITGQALVNHLYPLKQLDLLFRDGLRLGSFQPANLPRYTSQSIEYDGVTIPGGTTVLIHHRSGEKNRHEHTPTLKSAEEIIPKLRTPEAAAFSFGPRSCPGSELTKIIFKAIFAVMIDFDLKLKKEDAPTPIPTSTHNQP